MELENITLSKVSQPGSEGQKLHVLPHADLDQKQMQ
jgi:hypothetical protein